MQKSSMKKAWVLPAKLTVIQPKCFSLPFYVFLNVSHQSLWQSDISIKSRSRSIFCGRLWRPWARLLVSDCPRRFAPRSVRGQKQRRSFRRRAAQMASGSYDYFIMSLPLAEVAKPAIWLKACAAKEQRLLALGSMSHPAPDPKWCQINWNNRQESWAGWIIDSVRLQ